MTSVGKEITLIMLFLFEGVPLGAWKSLEFIAFLLRYFIVAIVEPSTILRAVKTFEGKIMGQADLFRILDSQ